MALITYNQIFFIFKKKRKYSKIFLFISFHYRKMFELFFKFKKASCFYSPSDSNEKCFWSLICLSNVCSCFCSFVENIFSFDDISFCNEFLNIWHSYWNIFRNFLINFKSSIGSNIFIDQFLLILFSYRFRLKSFHANRESNRKYFRSIYMQFKTHTSMYFYYLWEQ